MQTIVAAFGEHDHATDALRWAAELASLSGAPLSVVNVFEPTYAEIAPDWFDDLIARRRTLIETILEEIGRKDDEIVVLDGDDPMEAVAGHLEAVDASLVVIGAHGTHRAGGFGAGHPAHHLLHNTRTPVAVVRPDYEALSGGTIVVGVDGSGANAAALRHAELLADALGGEIHTVFVYDPMDDAFSHAEGWHRHAGEVRAEIDHVTTVPAKHYQVAGHPAAALLEHAQRERAAAIVVGTRGRGGFDGLVLGRVPNQLIAHAPCALVVVPH